MSLAMILAVHVLLTLDHSFVNSQSGPSRRNLMHIVLATAKPFGIWDVPGCMWTAEAHLRPSHVPPLEFRASLPSSTTWSDSRTSCSGDQSPIRAPAFASGCGRLYLDSRVHYPQLISNKFSRLDAERQKNGHDKIERPPEFDSRAWGAQETTVFPSRTPCSFRYLKRWREE